MSTYGLDGVLPWAQARHVAAAAGRPQPSVEARLDEAAGGVLGSALVTPLDDPPVDSAQVDGFAVRGEGPWLLEVRRPEDGLDDDAPVTAGHAVPVEAGQPIPRHTDAVLPSDETVQAKAYPYARPTFFYTNGEPAGLTAQFVEFMLGAEGQYIAKKVGFVPVAKE